MAYSKTLNLVAGDTLPELEMTLKDSSNAATGFVLDPDDSTTWAAIDITGASVKLKLRELGSSEIRSTLNCAITDPVAGKCATNFPTGTISEAGTFEGEIEITFVNGGIQTVFDLIKLKVRSDFG